MNAAIRAVTRSALDRNIEVFGVRYGFQGLVDDALEPLRARDVGGVIHQGGTFLGSARSKEFRNETGRARAMHNLSRRGIEAVVVIGGNGSQSGAAALSAMGVPVVGVASINVTLEAIDRLRTTGCSHHRAFLVETMGRDCGYLALIAGLAGGAEVIAIPESEVTPQQVAERLDAAYQRGKSHAIVVVAEGAKYGTEALMTHFKENRDNIGFELRATTLGHVVRGAPPTAADRILATRLGVGAVEALADGKRGVLVGIKDNALCYTPLNEVAGRTKALNLELVELARILAK